jgi:hypothetical protein
MSGGLLTLLPTLLRIAEKMDCDLATAAEIWREANEEPPPAPKPIRLNEPRPGSYWVTHDSGWLQ